MKRLPALALILLLGACETPTTRETAIAQTARLTAQSQEMIEAARARAETQAPLVQRVAGPYVGRHASQLARETALPPVLRREVTVAMIFDDGAPANKLGDVEMSIETFAARLTRATGVPTRVKPDVYLPLSQLVPGRAQSVVQAQAGPVTAGAQTTTGAPRAPAAAIGAVGSVTVSLPARMVAPVPQILDLISVRLGISSRYTADGYLEFYRLASESFTVSTQPGDTTFSSQLGQTAQGGNNFSANTNMSTNTTTRSFTATVEVVRSLLTPVGTAIGNESTRQITVTDTAEVLSSVRALMTETNRALSTQIGIWVQVVSCVETRATDVGVDWFALYEAVLSKYGYNINFSGPKPVVNDNGGVFSISSIPGATGSSRWQGSSAFLRALAESGNTCVERRQTLFTTNGRPVAYAITNSFDYVSQTTASTTGVNAVAVGITTKTQTVGRILSALPVTIGEGHVSLDLTLNESILNALKQQSSGTGSAQQTVQLPDISAQQSRHTVVLAANEAAVIAGIDGVTHKEQRRALADNISPVFGGGVSGEARMERVFIVVSARSLGI